MKVIFVYSSEGMNALLPSTGQQRIKIRNVGLRVGALRASAEPTKEKSRSQYDYKQTSRIEGAHPLT